MAAGSTAAHAAAAAAVGGTDWDWTSTTKKDYGTSSGAAIGCLSGTVPSNLVP